MESVRFIHHKPYLAIMMVAPVVLGVATWYGERWVDLWWLGHYLVFSNSQLVLFSLGLLGGLALVYRAAELLHLALPPLVPFLHVVVSGFCLVGLLWALNAAVPSGTALAETTLDRQHGWAEFLALLLMAIQLLLVAALIYELVRKKTP